MLEKEQILALTRPQSQCAECGALLDQYERHPSRMRLRGEEIERADFCPDCWQFAKNDAYEGYWLAVRPKKDARLPKLSRREKAVAVRALFESLWEKRDREDVEAHLFYVAHLLMKWGGLRWKCSRVTPEGGETIFFENPATGDTVEIRSVETDEASIAGIHERIESFLREYAPEMETAQVE